MERTVEYILLSHGWLRVALIEGAKEWFDSILWRLRARYACSYVEPIGRLKSTFHRALRGELITTIQYAF